MFQWYTKYTILLLDLLFNTSIMRFLTQLLKDIGSYHKLIYISGLTHELNITLLPFILAVARKG